MYEILRDSSIDITSCIYDLYSVQLKILAGDDQFFFFLLADTPRRGRASARIYECVRACMSRTCERAVSFSSRLPRYSTWSILSSTVRPRSHAPAFACTLQLARHGTSRDALRYLDPYRNINTWLMTLITLFYLIIIFLNIYFDVKNRLSI